MRISYKWLKEFVEINVSPQKLAEDLTMFGHEVETISKVNNDYVLDCEITPNRGDLLSIYGMAREIAALYNKKVTSYKLQVTSKKLDKNIKVTIQEAEICPRFTARIIEGIEVKSSPKWIQERLKSYGFRSLNNVVDITNLAMIEMGQPLHTFDYDKIEKGKMMVRRAKKGESVITLDGQDRKLDGDSVIIEDGKKIFDLAGIMGGYNSEVDNKTKTIILQGAIFDPVLIRRTSKRLNHLTDASYRYERGVDPEGTVCGVDRATELIKQTCPQAQISQLIDIRSTKPSQITIQLDINKVNNLLGTKFSQKTALDYLKRLGFNYNKDKIIIPSYRKYDVTIWQDLAEEIARIYGYNKLGTSSIKKTSAKKSEEYDKKEYLKDLMAEKGFIEVYSYSFVDKRLLERLGYRLVNCRKVINGLSPETEYLRPDLLPSLLTTVAKNPWAPEIKIFEIGKVFQTRGSTRNGTRIHTEKERWQLGIAITDKSDQVIKKFLSLLNLRSEIVSVDQKVLDFLKIRRPVKYAIIDLDKIKLEPTSYQVQFPEVKYKPVSEFPPTVRDLAFLVDNNIDAEKVRFTISTLSSQILLVELFDEFFSDKFGKNKKNIAFHIWLQDLKSPMKEEEVERIIKKIIKNIERKFQAKVRG